MNFTIPLHFTCDILMTFMNILVVLSMTISIFVHRPECKEPFSVDYWVRGSHARSVYPTKYSSSMKPARVKQEEEADTRVIEKRTVSK